ncbi:MAG: GspH/FimT family pseudopilin [Methylococcaceae bacterium]|jgi:general secretion pathway protein H
MSLGLDLVIPWPGARQRCQPGFASSVRVFNQGFTLVELVLVLFIIVLGFGVIGARFSSGQNATELKTTAHDITSALRHARGRALIHHHEQAVDFDLAQNSYQISGLEKNHKIPTSIDVTLDIAQSDIHSAGGIIRFFADGSSTGGRVTLSQTDKTARIDINWLTGQVVLDERLEPVSVKRSR